MAISVNGGGGYGSRRRAGGASLSEINVTPFVDVVLVVTITKDGTTYLNDKPVNINDLQAAIQQRFGKAKAIYVRADKETIWDPIAQVMAMLGQAGFQVNMVSQPEDSAAKGRK
jgi:biopolymer transport protein ExbD